MDKTPATLINQQGSTPLAPHGELAVWELRQSQPYFSPEYIVGAHRPHFGVPYWMLGIATQTCNFNYITAPTPLFKSQITHAAPVQYSAGQHPVGQAPTSGIYTGVEDHC